MVDMKMFKASYPNQVMKRPEDAFQLTEPIEEKDNFFLLLPSTVFGFNMQTKKWGKSLQFTV
jgi:hypothetical protein